MSRNENMITSYDNEQLTNEALSDLNEYGDDYNVIAVYSNFGGEIDYITDYVFGKPNRNEFHDLNDYEEALSDYNESLKTLHERKVKDMTLAELVKTLKEQAKLL